ncbi:MAG: hypothetical protein ACRC8K_05540 [Waterburya sp.]
MEFTFTPKDTNPVYLDSTLLTPGTVILPDNYTEYASVVVMINEGILKPLNSLTVSKIADEEAKVSAKKTRAKKVTEDAE